jgi:hypothetical protein
VLAYNKPELLRSSLSKLRKIHSGNVYIHLDGPQPNKRSIDLFNDCKKIILNARDSITLDINEPIELNRKRSISMNSTVYSKKFHNVIYL